MHSFAYLQAIITIASHTVASAIGGNSGYDLSETYCSSTDPYPTLLGHSITPRTAALPLGQCRDVDFKESTLSALCEVPRDDAGPPEIIPTSIQLNTCIANEGGTMVYQAE
jgi:hypothetical protein